MKDLKKLEVWFVTGSQHLDGPAALAQVSAHAQTVAASLGGQPEVPISVVFKPIVTTPEVIRARREANLAVRAAYKTMGSYVLTSKPRESS